MINEKMVIDDDQKSDHPLSDSEQVSDSLNSESYYSIHSADSLGHDDSNSKGYTMDKQKSINK